MSHDSKTPLVATEAKGAQSIRAAANYQIPLLWLSLFSLPDIKTVEIPLEDASGNLSVGGVPTLHAQLRSAKELYRARRPRIQGRIPDEFHRHMDEWDMLLEPLDANFIQIDLVEIWMMSTDEEFREEIKVFLTGLDDHNEDGWHALMEQAVLNDPDVAKCGLRGYKWITPVPWKD